MSTTLTCISGLRCKGPAAFVLETQGRRILLDFGRGPDHDALPDIDRIGHVDALVLSHGHPDHCGALHLLERIGTPPVFATEWLLHRLGLETRGCVLPAQGHAEVLGVPVETGRTGHAPGGVWLRVGAGSGLLYTGDYCPSSTLYAYDPPTPASMAVVDASYGTDDADPDAGRQALLDLVRDGPCLLPAPPDGRGPEMAVFLHEAGLEVSLDAPVFETVRALAANSPYVRPEMRAALARLAAAAVPLEAGSTPRGVMIAAGASGASGLARTLLDEWQGNADVRFVFTGYVAAGTPAQKLIERGRADWLRWHVHPTRGETQALVERVGARQVIPAFTKHPEALGLPGCDALPSDVYVVPDAVPFQGSRP